MPRRLAAVLLTAFVLEYAAVQGAAQRGAAAPGAGRVPSDPPGAAACRALTSLSGRDLPNITASLTSTTLRAASGAQPPSGPFAPPTPALPEHCDVVGEMNNRFTAGGERYAINFRLRLPTTWNGRFFFEGGGGTNGTVGSAYGNLQGQQPTVALALGYAVVSQDSGHDNATNTDADSGGAQAFGLDPQARIDFGYRSYDQVTQVSKAIIRRYYGRAPDKSYYVGCSEGGREGMMLSQRFAAHFDGVLACAPGFHLPQAALAAVADSKAFAAVAREADLRDPNGLPLLNKTFTDEDLALVSTAVLAACDALDGASDALVQDFTACTTALVAPRLAAITCAGAKTPSCLTPTQVSALTTVAAGAKTSAGAPIYASRPWDAGIGGKSGATFYQGWRAWKLGAYAAATNTSLDLNLSTTALASIFMTPPMPVSTSGGDQVAFGLSLDLAQAQRALAATSGNYRESALQFMKADATDLSAFRKRGGRLIIVHGVSDPVFSINDTVAWWNAVNRGAAGRAAEFVRLFAVPGMNHCSGGPATDQFNAFEALVAWVEKGTVPERIGATARASTPWPGRTRPLCPYPQVARYSGTGSLEDAASFVCK